VLACWRSSHEATSLKQGTAGPGAEAIAFRGSAMIERSLERRAFPREIINVPALISFHGIRGVHPCVIRNISDFGACISTPYYMFASNFDLSFDGFQRTFGCRVMWRRATLCGVARVMRDCMGSHGDRFRVIGPVGHLKQMGRRT